MKRLILIIFIFLATVGIFPAATAAAADPVGCTGEYSIGVGGLQLGIPGGSWENSAYIVADNHIGYDSLNPLQGLRNLEIAYDLHRDMCPSDRIKLVGHSEGAALVHVWVTEHQDATNVSAVLLADPKRVAGPGGAGLAANPLGALIGYPLAGVDDDFGSVPVLSVCHQLDAVCNEHPAGWVGYVAGAHTSYNTIADDYRFGVSGVWFF
jgi:cutinase